MKVLIGEENRPTRTLLENAMEVMGFEVKKVENAGSLIDSLKEEDFDILFLSWNLSDEDSFEFIRDIGEIKKSGKPYIILMMPENKKDMDLTEYPRDGMNDFLVKPVNRDLIRSRIRKARIELEIGERGLTIKPLEDLKKDHHLLRRMANIFEVVHYRIKDEVPQKVLDWMDSMVNTLDQEVHHQKERHYLISFIENAMEEHGESPDSKLFSRASLKRVEEEHEKLEEMTKEIHQVVEDYKDGKVEAGNLRDILRGYKELIRDHIDREERFLFPLSEKYMNEETSKELMQKFNKIEEKVGREKIEKFEKQISKGEEKLYLKS